MHNTALLSLSLASALWAGRPFVTDDAGTVPQQGFEIEIGMELQDGAQAPIAAIKHGVTKQLDIGIGHSSSTLPWEANCVNGHTLDLKFALWPEHIALATSTDLGSGATLWNAIGSFSLGNFETHGNAGIELAENGEEIDYGLLFRYSNGVLGTGLELFGCSDDPPKAALGLQAAPTEYLSVDAGIAHPLGSGPWQVNVGLTLNIPGVSQ